MVETSTCSNIGAIVILCLIIPLVWWIGKWFWIEEFKVVIDGLEGDDDLIWFEIEKKI